MGLDEDCGLGDVCHQGRCVPTRELKQCTGPSDASTECDRGGAESGVWGCCGGWCCPQAFQRQWQNFTCFSDIQCRHWQTGKYCCSNKKCCNILENVKEDC